MSIHFPPKYQPISLIPAVCTTHIFFLFYYVIGLMAIFFRCIFCLHTLRRQLESLWPDQRAVRSTPLTDHKEPVHTPVARTPAICPHGNVLSYQEARSIRCLGVNVCLNVIIVFYYPIRFRKHPAQKRKWKSHVV